MIAKNKIGVLIWILVGLFLIWIGYGCVGQRATVAKSGKCIQLKKVAPAVGVAKTKAPKKGIYDIEVKPLVISDCVRCHVSEFNRIKKEGGKHSQVACTDCHQTFHAYNPLRKNYKKIMPKCSMCHEKPHGKARAVQNCTRCHTDAHRPIASLLKPDKMEGQCRICHSNVAKSMKKYPSDHTGLECSACHSQRHGRIPDCSECHESHSPMVAMKTQQCLKCHPAHTPLKITYSQNIENNKVCAGCHEKEYDLLQKHQTKHSKLACATCHPAHKQIITCRECHGTPHSPVINKKYPNCLSCHNSPHDLH